MITYIQAISLNYPNVQCSCIGDGSDYNTLVWEAGDPLPTKAELDAVIAANPNIFTSMLPDGEPTYFYSPAALYLGVSKSNIIFSTSVNNAKNFYLNYGALNSRLNGYIAISNSIITTATLSISSAVANDTIFEIRSGNSTLGEFILPANQTSKVLIDLVTLLAANQMISVYIRSQSSISNPFIMLEIHDTF